MYCSKCGANVADGIAFCSACGQPMVGFSVGQAAAATPAAPGGTVYAQPAQAGWQAPAARPAVAYAGFWLRVVAFIIDALVLYFVGMIVMLPFAASMGMGMRGMMTGRPPNMETLLPLIHAMIRLTLLRTILNWLYYSLLESSAWQATLGKKALGLEVTDLDGNRISFGRATGRFFAKIISSIILGIGYLMAGFTEKKQALHDILAGTLVIRKL
jgi:uncharacterized RDD family membrane protein YckC